MQAYGLPSAPAGEERRRGGGGGGGAWIQGTLYLAREDLAIVDGRLDHAVANAILDTGAGLHDLQFGSNARDISLCHAIEVHHGRPTCATGLASDSATDRLVK